MSKNAEREMTEEEASDVSHERHQENLKYEVISIEF